MSLHKCPQCKEHGFFWKVDDDISALTIWDCLECGYHAFEDESKESTCPKCDYKFRIYLKDENFTYWWCSKFEEKLKEL